MPRCFLILILVLLGFDAAASSTLRVGNQVLVAGDSSARAIELLGKPSHQSRRHGSRQGRRTTETAVSTAGERWQYRRNGRTTTLTIVDDRITDIEDGRD